MPEVILQLNEAHKGAFKIEEHGHHIAEMVVAVKGQELHIYHTEVADDHQGQGLAKQLLDAMVNYARTRHLQVVPYCVYVQGQFKRNPELYADIWKRTPETE
ncbi:GNAT family N-acetyltransferase [Deminuibacter soli]|uniref:N-acetyltransferase n=1 Tax=Deminuibacter soli TaxID=2291815 RepID=A0A3E1NJ54_9BACT|nr:GNAT family N-acetyltransferase [Deminuibacter soli]RFM27854.1 N-acetyltransferase [Deminuibacter soli]